MIHVGDKEIKIQRTAPSILVLNPFLTVYLVFFLVLERLKKRHHPPNSLNAEYHYSRYGLVVLGFRERSTMTNPVPMPF